MDRKILEKRKKNDIEEMLRKKEYEERKRQEQKKSELEKKGKNKEKENNQKKIENGAINHINLPPNVRELPACVRRL